MAKNIKLDDTRMGALDGNKAQGAKGIVTRDRRGPTTMAAQLGRSFSARWEQGEKSTIDYIVTLEAKVLLQAAEKYLLAKQAKYGKGATNFNTNTDAVLRYLMDFLDSIGLKAASLVL